MSPAAARAIVWSPRILSGAFAIFLCLFALDVFSEEHGFWRIVVALGIHLVPALIVVAVLAAAWRWEWVGAVIYALSAAAYAMSVLPKHPDWAAVIALPLLAMAVLFLASWVERRKVRAAR